MKNADKSKIILKIILLVVFLIFFIAVFVLDSVFWAGDAISYGKFGSCGRIITLIMLVVSYIFICFTLFGKKRKRIYTIFSVAFVVLVVPVLLLANTIVVNREYKTFDSAKWKDYSNYSHGRQYMIDDFESKHQIVGMKIYDVYDLLGRGSEETLVDGSHEVTYDVGTAGVWHNTYVLKYDENGIVTETYTEPR